MTTDKYFEREYNYLQHAGEEFSKKHPTLGSRLHLSERERKDPFVERLFEGFAFLAGRIHERLDDEFPEFTGGLLEILTPQLLKPFPSCSILQADYKTGAVTQPVTINKGSEIQTESGRYKIKYKVHAGPREKTRITEKEEPAEFIFRTVQDLVVRPMKLENVSVQTNTQGNSELIIKIKPDRNTSFENLKLNNLQLYLHGADSIKYTLLLFLSKYVKSISVRELGSDGSEYRKIPKWEINIPGLERYKEDIKGDYSILPYSERTFSGYRLLHEYFSFPEKFFFVEVSGLEKHNATNENLPFEIRFEFDRKLDEEINPSINNILLHCAPIVNLFKRSVEEVVVDQLMPEYYIIPDLDRKKSREIYSVDKVTGISENKLEQYIYVPITAHDILDTNDPEYNYKRFYSIVRKSVKGDMSETFIRLFGESMEGKLFHKETLSLEATLSNGFLPASYLTVGSINQPLEFPVGVVAKNITLPSEMLEGPVQQNYLWSLIELLSISYTTLSNAENLKGMLRLFNWIKKVNNPNIKRIQGINNVHTPTVKGIMKGHSFIRGIDYKIEVDADEFENGEGDIYLFGSVLNQFLNHYITVNSFIELTIIEKGTGKEYKWMPTLGEKLPI